MSDIQKKFYVLRAISGKENKVREYLEAELKNTDLGEYVSQVLIPTEKTFTVRNGKKVMKERAYLPGYVLVEAALVGEVAHRLRNIPNVIGFLGGSDTPVPLRPAEVNRILGTVDELQEQQEDLDIQFYVGESVKITFGPFSGFTGIIEEVNAEKKKLKVMVKVFGRSYLLQCRQDQGTDAGACRGGTGSDGQLCGPLYPALYGGSRPLLAGACPSPYECRPGA